MATLVSLPHMADMGMRSAWRMPAMWLVVLVAGGTLWVSFGATVPDARFQSDSKTVPAVAERTEPWELPPGQTMDEAVARAVRVQAAELQAEHASFALCRPASKLMPGPLALPARILLTSCR
jgi:hypothetical protein